MAPRLTIPPTHTSRLPSLLPQQAFTVEEGDIFDEMEDDADIDALVEFLFPDR